MSVAGNHALVDGNKGLGLAAVIAFYGLNGRRLTMTNDEAYDFIMSITHGTIDDIAVIAKHCSPNVETPSAHHSQRVSLSPCVPHVDP